ncbi:hypothetical protein CC86DRAFT_425604 [Ophiobolus disseminans]|uniref:F-box domain-containing protein n=1 Tax=Ophiobolus disseminans TaxID=1469910 RepID=A0A6A6ZLP1_9PLEO|nr:hypothetical protein CC86DRAFT_425604 [Ophiobolus disseminans]
MTRTLDQLPYDVLFYIASSLHLDDIIRLGQTCHHLRAVLDERTLHRCIVETFPHAEEAHLARTKLVTYKQALQAIYDRRNAMSNAYPFSARVLKQGNAFLYRQGVICVQAGEMVHVSAVRAPFNAVELDLAIIIRPIMQSIFDSLGAFRCSMLYYGDEILSILVEADCRPNVGHIFAISTAREPPNSRRVIRVVPTTSISKLFVRHTSQYLYYGTHTGMGDDGHHKWEIFGAYLDEQPLSPATKRPLLLEDFHGTDIGSTVAFEIYNDYFYAVSNQGTFEVEEVDWTSFYHCVRFPLKNPALTSMETDERVYRRQHAQGPIHDSWTDLSLQASERTNEVMIIESRREWAQASSRQSRTFYTSRFQVRPHRSSRESSLSEEPTEALPLPENDLFVDLLDSTNKPNWMPTPPQYSWSRHPEFGRSETSPRSFILARTKFRAYSHACTSFLDIVEDERCCNEPSKPPCLRLRVGSQHEASLNFPPLNRKGKGRANELEPQFEDHVKYAQPPIRMWPPPASKCPCSKRLHAIINPPLASGPSHARSVTGVLDERTLVFMVKPGRSYGASDDTTLGSIVVIDFTRPWKTPDSTPSSRPPLVRYDSKMDLDGEEVADDYEASSWQWTPGQKSRCHTGTCR